jgi:serine/threonine protein kinase
MSSAATSPIGVITHYNLLERLDPAGPGELYRARDTRKGRTVSVRLLPKEYTADNAALIERARGVTTLSHPNVITLFDVGEHEGRVFLVFEFMKGQSLRAEMAGRQVNVRKAVELAIHMADAVADAHAAGFIHGGLSPESVVVTAKGHAKIPAFELAASGGFEQAEGGMRLRDYDSPEEARGEAPDDRSDIYSVGAILYEMLTGRRPSHRGASAPSASNPHVPAELDQVVLKAAAPNPDSRHQSVATLAGELRSVLPILDVREDAADEQAQMARSTSMSRVVVTTALLLIVAAAVLWWLFGGRT